MSASTSPQVLKATQKHYSLLIAVNISRLIENMADKTTKEGDANQGNMPEVETRFEFGDEKLENIRFKIRTKNTTLKAQDTRIVKAIHSSINKAIDKGQENIRTTERVIIKAQIDDAMGELTKNTEEKSTLSN